MSSDAPVTFSVMPEPYVSPVTCGIRPIARYLVEIYCYTIDDEAHDGRCKIGMARAGRVEERIREQTHTVDVTYKIHWHVLAIFEPDSDGVSNPFKDYQFHSYLERLGYKRKKGTEWFVISPDEALARLMEFKLNRGIIKSDVAHSTLVLRPEQERCIRFIERNIEEQRRIDPNCIVRVLINAKTRFGKTPTMYSFIMRKLFKNVLVMTSMPSVGDSWLREYLKFVSGASRLAFVSDCPSVAGMHGVVPSAEYDRLLSSGKVDGRIAFVSMQDLKGAIDFGGKYDKLRWVAETRWDAVLIDEAHNGVDTMKATAVLDHLDHGMEVYLSGTPFFMLAEGKFPDSAVFNWTYPDEQEAKRRCEKSGGSNPYSDLPRMELMSYMLSRIVLGRAIRGAGDIDGDGVDESYAFSLPEFFKTDSSGRFVHEKDVLRFVDTLASADGFPFASRESREQFRHTFWLLDRVASAKALCNVLRHHRYFKDYEIVVVAGHDNLSDVSDLPKHERTAIARVRNAIKTGKKTITLSVGRLTAGVTVPEWTGVLILSGVRSPQVYIQTAGRAGTPWSYVDSKTGETVEKQSFAVFDFDPARQLTMVPSIAGGFYRGDCGDGSGTADEIRRLLNYINVYGQSDDEVGEMHLLDAEQILTLPTDYNATRVVQHGFRDNCIVCNLNNVFRSVESERDTMSDILGRLKSNDEAPIDVPSNGSIADIDENGNVSVDTKTLGHAADILGDKVYGELDEPIEELYDKAIDKANEEADAAGETDFELEALKRVAASITTDAIEAAQNRTEAESIGDARMKKVKSNIKAKADAAAEHALVNHRINENKANRDMEEDIDTVRKNAAERAVKVVADMEAGVEYDMWKTDPDGIPIHADDVELVESLKRNGMYDDIAAAVNDEWERNGKKPTKDVIDTFGVTPADSLDIEKIVSRMTDEAVDASLSKDDRTVIEWLGDERDRKVEQSRKQMLDFVKNGDDGNGIVDMAAREVVKAEREKKAEESKRRSMYDIRVKIRDMMTPVPMLLFAYAVYGKGEVTADNIWSLCPEIDVKRFINIEREEAAWITDRFINKIVFNKAIKKFVETIRKLARFFDPDVVKNGDAYMLMNNPCNSMVYTPLRVIIEQIMQQMKEAGIDFDNPAYAFCDIYMKSGRYPAEEVKLLYNNERMKELIPNDEDRIRHCLMQVSGFAPTQSMLDCAMAYLLGWLPEDERDSFKVNFELFDAENATHEEVVARCEALERKVRKRIYDDCVRLGIPYDGDIMWEDDEKSINKPATESYQPKHLRR